MADPVFFIFLSAMQKLVAVSHAVCTHIGGRTNFGNAGAPHPVVFFFWGGAWLTLGNTPRQVKRLVRN